MHGIIWNIKGKVSFYLNDATKMRILRISNIPCTSFQSLDKRLLNSEITQRKKCIKLNFGRTFVLCRRCTVKTENSENYTSLFFRVCHLKVFFLFFKFCKIFRKTPENASESNTLGYINQNKMMAKRWWYGIARCYQTPDVWNYVYVVFIYDVELLKFKCVSTFSRAFL